MNITTIDPSEIDPSEIGPVITRLRLQGRFDAHEAPGFRSELDRLLASGTVHLQVELSDVEFVDSTALAELIRGMKRCREAGGDLVLAAPSDPVRVILELTKLDAAFCVV